MTGQCEICRLDTGEDDLNLVEVYAHPEGWEAIFEAGQVIVLHSENLRLCPDCLAEHLVCTQCGNRYGPEECSCRDDMDECDGPLCDSCYREVREAT